MDLSPKRFGNYVLLDRVGVGGMAEVFRARQSGIEGFAKMVAIKRILPHVAEDDDFVEMFVEEAKLAVQMGHANVAQIYDLGTIDGSYFIAMEYVPGFTLRTIWDRARRRGRLLPFAMSAYIMQHVCEGLDYAHKKKDEQGRELGLVHRDVSPQNILVSFEGEVKVVDFGIAKVKHKVQKTQAGVLKGKFGYMSPEQVGGRRELDQRSDIFSCGTVLWELLVGERLFLGGSEFSTLERVRKAEVIPPDNMNEGLDPRLSEIVLKALAKDPEERYQHASDMAAALQKFLYSSDQLFGRTDLARYMKRHFEKEIDEEYARLDAVRKLDLAADEAPPAALDGAFVTPIEDDEVTDEATPLEPAAVSSAIPSASSAVAAQPSASPLPSWVKPTIASLAVMVVVTLGMVVFLALGGLNPDPGALSIETDPSDAEIYLNGDLVSTRSPFVRNELSAGTYFIEVKKSGFETESRPVKIGPGEAVMETVKLTKK